MVMKIRQGQINALSKTTEASFLDRMVDLVTDAQEPARSDPAVRQQCQQLMDGASGHGFVTEFEVGAYVACGVEFGQDFDVRQDLAFPRILQEPDTAARIKAAQMLVVLEESENGQAPEV
jgi:hypothetical protein